MTFAINHESSTGSTFPRITSVVSSLRMFPEDSRRTFTVSRGTSGWLAPLTLKEYSADCSIKGISTVPECPRLTSLSSPKDVQTRTSAPAGSFVSHEITTEPCPNEVGFGFGLMFPVITPDGRVLLTRKPRISLLLPERRLVA